MAKMKVPSSFLKHKKRKSPHNEGLEVLLDVAGLKMAEREGFEPSVGYNPHTRLAGEHLQPTRSPLRPKKYSMCGGGSRIRTHGTFVQRFSRPPPSTTRPSLRHPTLCIYSKTFFLDVMISSLGRFPPLLLSGVCQQVVLPLSELFPASDIDQSSPLFPRKELCFQAFCLQP